MKRLFSTLVMSIITLSASISASAQFFDQLSFGIGAGVDGVSAQVAVPVGGILQLRAGGGYVPKLGYAFTLNNVEVADGLYTDLYLKGRLDMITYHAMMDLFPGKRAKFHFTFGVIGGNRSLLELYNTEPFLDEEDWGSAGITIGKTMITTDENGIAKVNARVNRSLMPYAGIGVGRGVSDFKAVTFNFDIGVCYSEGVGVYTNGTNMLTGETESVRIASADIDNADDGWLDKINSFPLLPVMKFTLFFRIF